MDAIVDAINNNANAAREAAHEKFVEAQWVKQIKMLHDNYVDSQKFYNRMKVVTDHRGGVAGYFSDEMKNRGAALVDDEYWELQSWWNRDPKEATTIQSLINSGDAAIKKELDHSEKIRVMFQKREEEREKIANEAVGPLKPEKMDEMNLKIGLMTLEVLSSIDAHLQHTTNANLRTNMSTWQQEKKQLQEIIVAQMKLKSQAKKDEKTHTQKVYEVLKKTPGETIEAPIRAKQ